VILDHLVKAEEADYVPTVVNAASVMPLDKATPAQTLSAQKKTADWLTQITEDDEEILTEAQEAKVINTFNALTQADPKAKEKLLTLELPEEIQNVVGMVTAYQWKFVEQANELRSMAVTKIAKETEHPDARIRLKALELLGKVTEVALFTDRVEVKREELSDEELEKRIKAKLERYMGVVDVVDAEINETEAADIEVLPENNEKE
jgi:delta 1-pyrroline-5-carboxylate dehydrogenase